MSVSQPLFLDSNFGLISVSELTFQLKEVLEGIPDWAQLCVEGEISNLSRPSSGHIYFTLKDSSAQIKCAMWKTQVLRTRPHFQQGDRVHVYGKLGLYERDGIYQIYVDRVVAVGTGEAYIDIEQLRQKLLTEGLFDQERKRPLPAFPRKIGLVTSADTAAFHDVIHVLTRRYPLAQVLFSASSVQGAEAPAQLIAGLHRLYSLPEKDRPDVILVARGGGSAEDLGAFNHEQVVRAIAHAPVPLITGIGHEVDFTLADFAADMRAPTPSAAAELLTPDKDDLYMSLQTVDLRMTEQVQYHLQYWQNKLHLAAQELQTWHPTYQVQSKRACLQLAAQRLEQSTHHGLEQARHKLNLLQMALDNASPKGHLQRGYLLATDASTGKTVNSAVTLTQGTRLVLHFADGQRFVIVE